MNDSISDSPRRPRKGRGKLAVIGAVAVALAGFGAWKLLGPKEEEGGYLFAKVEMGSIEDLVTATGTLEPRDYVDVGAQVSGQIEKIYVEVGDEVKVGQVLAEIDAEQASARVEANKAQLRSSETSLLTQRNNLEKAKRDYQRQLNLKKEDATTEEAVINAKTTLDNAENQIIQSEASIAQQKANMRIEERNLQYTKITAPIDGTVMSIAVKEGQSVNASQSVPNVMRLADLRTMTVRADVSEADVAKVYKGMSVYFTPLSAGQSRRYFGELKRIEPTPKTQQGVILYPALFDVENPIVNGRPELMPNATAQVFFVAAEARDVLTVPMAALQQGQQIARELAMKEREQAQAGAAAAPGGPPGAGGPPGMAGSAPPDAASGAPGARAGGEGGAGPGADAPGGNRMAGNGGPPRGGNRNGGGGFGGFNGQLTPEQIAEFQARRGGGGGGGGFGGFRGMGGGAAAAPGVVQQRRGTVMVKKADGELEARQVVVGVNDRVRGQVIEGLAEGEEVVVGKRETEPLTGPTATGTQNNQNNNQFRGNQGGFQGGGGGFRPF
ncbi:MAG: efflux RND transporter periplasmic adaptor subunit [Pseudomonadota bacterium]|nr:efflux RND transporter periplasmic adaptor subunit [Pseudomonadota bacterium]